MLLIGLVADKHFSSGVAVQSRHEFHQYTQRVKSSILMADIFAVVIEVIKVAFTTVCKLVVVHYIVAAMIAISTCLPIGININIHIHVN
jgi:hypothetical protein